MKKTLNPLTSLYNRAWIRDDNTNAIYSEDAMLIALLSHTKSLNRAGKQGKLVRQLLDDINLED